MIIYNQKTGVHAAALLCCGALIALIAANIPEQTVPPALRDTETWIFTEQIRGEAVGLLYDSALGAFRFATLAPDTQPPKVLALSETFGITQSGESVVYPMDRPALTVTFFQNASDASAWAEMQADAQMISFLTWTCVFVPAGAG